MDKEKIKIKKHDHRLTDLLKVSIFSLVMMAPVAAIGVTCAYVVCNKNAYQSYYGQTINEKNYQQITNFVQNEDYYFLSSNDNNNQSVGGNNPQFTFQSIEVISSLPNLNTTDYNKVINSNNGFLYFNSGTNARTIALRQDEENYIYLNLSTNILEFQFNGLQLVENNKEVFISYLKQIEYNKYSYLDNVFYYAVDTMQNNTLFSWTKNTAIYTGIETMTTGLGITTASVPVLLTYWFLITVIYIIIDIVITMFTWITHLIGER